MVTFDGVPNNVYLAGSAGAGKQLIIVSHADCLTCHSEGRSVTYTIRDSTLNGFSMVGALQEPECCNGCHSKGNQLNVPVLNAPIIAKYLSDACGKSCHPSAKL